MADARTSRQARNVRERISSTHQKRWRALCSVCGLERSVLCRIHSDRSGRMRPVLWSVRSYRPPGPTIIQTVPKPDYFFLWLYGLLSYLPPAMETPALLIGPVVVIAFLVLLPFLSGEGEKSWRRRPIAVLTVLLIAIILGTLTHLAGYTPWSPHMNAWSGDPVPDNFCMAAPRFSDKVRWFSRASSVVTAIPSVRVAASEVQHLIVSPCA